MPITQNNRSTPFSPAFPQNGTSRAVNRDVICGTLAAIARNPHLFLQDPEEGR